MNEHLVIEAFLMGLIVFLIIRQNEERSSLIDRIMARDLPELVTYENERAKALATKVRMPLNPSIEL